MGDRGAAFPSTGGRRHIIHASSLGVTSVFTKSHEQVVVDHAVDADEEVLPALGYKQESAFSRLNLTRLTAHTDVNNLPPDSSATSAYGLASPSPSPSSASSPPSPQL